MQKDGTMPDRIRDRAYQLWEAEGRPHGRDQAHWLAAERELAAASGAAGEAIAAPAARATRTRRSSNGSGARGGRKRKTDEAHA